jgi:hypothetical protein
MKTMSPGELDALLEPVPDVRDWLIRYVNISEAELQVYPDRLGRRAMTVNNRKPRESDNK